MSKSTKRDILRLCGVSILGGLAGCSNPLSNGVQDSDGDGITDSEDYAPQDPDVQEQSDIQSNEDTESTGEATSTSSKETEKEALGAYESGFSELNFGVRVYNIEGSDSYIDERYTDAVNGFRRALEKFESAQNDFENAADLASNAGHPRAKKMASSASSQCDYWIRAAETGMKIAEAAQDGDFDRASNLIDKGDDIIRAKDNSKEGFVSKEQFEEALGLAEAEEEQLEPYPES